MIEKNVKPAKVSTYFESKKPSDVRLGSIKVEKRTDSVELINCAIGNVSLPMYPKMIERLQNLGQSFGGFEQGVVKYEATVGNPETIAAFKNILKHEGFDSSNLHVQVTDGASLAMEVAMLGICGGPGEDDRPLLMFDPTYTNYNSVARRLGRKTVTVNRTLDENGHFTFPSIEEIEKVILEEQPGGMLIIPYDNPTGQMYEYEMMLAIAELCVKHNLWLLSDEAYRGLFYDEHRELISIWGLTDEEVPGIEGRRISLESASKVWNACGLRIGALITDNKEFAEKAEAEYTTNLSANSIGQHIFGALAHESKEEIVGWLKQSRNYYRQINRELYQALKKTNPDFLVSQPESSIYLVVDVKNIVGPDFDSVDFVSYCAEHGRVVVDGVPMTLLAAPMTGFYNKVNGQVNPGNTQIRLSFCETIDKLKYIPVLLDALLKDYETQRFA
ncbi:MAG TPA: aminotransferase class I/II-fold pyridoxal phosphate-dependent enzyme [Atopostipes sp.]|nr:aminotransferase class I/II-fold pyridoxal phosphate-dependent enzyme [Atopostipes sp.]